MIKLWLHPASAWVNQLPNIMFLILQYTVHMVLNRCQTPVGFYNYSFPAQYAM